MQQIRWGRLRPRHRGHQGSEPRRAPRGRFLPAVLGSLAGASLLTAQVPDQEALAAELRSLISAPNEGASRRIQQAIASPQAVEVITSEQIRAIGAFRLADVLKMATSIQVWDLDGDRASVTLRGVAPSGLGVTVQILLDGIPMYNVVGEPINLNALPVPIDAIEKIEIVRGPSSSLYGANAQMGVIAITTRRAGYGNAGSLRAGLTGNGMHRQEGFFSIKDGSVLQGPPPRPLPRIVLETRGQQLVAIEVKG